MSSWCPCGKYPLFVGNLQGVFEAPYLSLNNAPRLLRRRAIQPPQSFPLLVGCAEIAAFLERACIHPRDELRRFGKTGSFPKVLSRLAEGVRAGRLIAVLAQLFEVEPTHRKVQVVAV